MPLQRPLIFSRESRSIAYWDDRRRVSSRVSAFGALRDTTKVRILLKCSKFFLLLSLLTLKHLSSLLYRSIHRYEWWTTVIPMVDTQEVDQCDGTMLMHR